jgi:hypothetical protein
VILLLVVDIIDVVILIGLFILVGVVVLLPLRAVDDEVSGVTALEAAPRVLGASPPLLPKHEHRPKFPCKQGNLIIRNALILLIRSCRKRRQSKHSRGGEMLFVGLASWTPTRALVIKALLLKEAS